MEVFWRRGYEGASLPELTAAMGINRPSLYAAYGNKEALFRKAVARYAQGPASYVREALALSTARAVAERLLRGVVQGAGDPGKPRGCLMVQGALACGTESESVRRELAAHRAAMQDEIAARFERAKAEGDLPARADPAALAQYVATIMQGMSVQAAGGATCEELGRVVDLALGAWPT